MVWGPTKVPHFNRGILSNHLEMPEEQIHFIEQDVGGGFGIRGEFYPEDFLIPFAAMKVGRPVKWIEDRLEHLISSNHSREVMAAYGEPRSFFLGQIAEFHTLESSMRTHKFREAVAVVGVDKTECLQCIQCNVKIRDLLWDDD